MGFNYGLERKKFEREWTKLRKEYAEAGMSDEAIQQMYEYDLSVFNRKRADAKHEQPFVGKMCEDIEENDQSKSALYEKFADELSYEDTYSFAEGRFSWIETIENEELYQKVSSLSNNDKEILTLLAIDEFSVTEIARIQNKAISTIWEKIARIKKYFH
jgi:DNA-directed RNA polymerase specialized sigma24 family protein